MDKLCNANEQGETRKGPWTMEEDMILINYVSTHEINGSQRSSFAYDLWSKIAKHLPGRTDNEIKNYWRTQIQKRLKQAPQGLEGQQTDSSTSTAADGAATDGGGNSGDRDARWMLPEFCSGSSAAAAPTTQNSMHEASTSTCFPEFDELSSVFNDDHGDSTWGMDELWPLQPFNGS
ncbi:Transcription factor [Nymphaea thermarum]|nr:Transcription factor [Nymphaea thermarum]